MFEDPIFRAPRKWSNKELRRFAKYFSGEVVNISGWRDEDKEGAHYRDYFLRASNYYISNYNSEARGFQGSLENEFFLDLTAPIPEALKQRFDVVFNHTVLEHVFEVNTALDGICSITKDIVILVVPFLQEQHADYGDYWRFTPLCVNRLFKDRGFTTLYLSYNDSPRTSVYVFAVASRYPSKWGVLAEKHGNKIDHLATDFAGTAAVSRGFAGRAKRLLRAFKGGIKSS